MGLTVPKAIYIIHRIIILELLQYNMLGPVAQSV